MKKRHKYTLVFFITFWAFAAAWYVSSFANKEKFTHIQGAQDKIAIDILSSEAQIDLLEEASCEDVKDLNFSSTLSSLASKISYSEENLNNPEEAISLKKQYSILQVKDFLLSKKISAKCKTPLNTIIYFYGTKINCPACVKQGYVLDSLRQRYPNVRIYAFDYTLDLSTIHTMKTIYKVEDKLPVLVVNGQTLSGFQGLDDLAALVK